MAITSGTRFGRYEIRSLLGTGGMGEVYLSQDTQLDRKVALKILPAEVASDKQRMLRFVQEAKAASALNHPNILTVHEIGQENSIHFIVTEFIDGVTLRQRLTDAPMEMSEALEITIQVAEALAAAHADGIVHRDIKPENIMIRRDGYVKVLDFGLAKLAERPTTDESAQTLAMTEPGLIIGTTQYMSPEQVRGLKVDTRTDIFSLGVTLYEMVAGCSPFTGATRSDVIAAILDREPGTLLRHARGVPAELERIAMKALAKEREERYQTAKDLLIDLRRLRQQPLAEAEHARSMQSEAKTAVIEAKRQEPAAGASGVEPAARLASGKESFFNGLKRHQTGVMIAVIALAAVATFVYFFGSRPSPGGANPDQAIDSIAVLPLANASGDANAEYLSDGITESIINSLSQLPRLRVQARATVFRYKGRDIDPQTAGRELNVQAVLMGRVQQRGDSLVIQADLVNVADGSQMWGARYNRKLSDIFTVQEEIAREISEKLRLRLTGEERERVTRSYTENIEAYRLYLKGRYEANKFTPEGLQKSIEYYNQAIALDPAYAPAYVGLAISYRIQANTGVFPANEVYPKANLATRKAIELDDRMAEARIEMVQGYLFYEYDRAAAEKEIARALELNPNSRDVHFYRHYFFETAGRVDEDKAAMKRAEELDPLSPIVGVNTGMAHYFAREYDAAIEQYRKTLGLDPQFFLTHLWLGHALEQKGLYPEAIAAYQQALALSKRHPRVLASLGHAYAMTGRRNDALKVLDELMQMQKRRYVQPFSIALLYTGLGEKDQAFIWLEKSYAERDYRLSWLKVDPQLDSLRTDPRFRELLGRIGLSS
jgi:eukaryotic-like serine/threonine-protein kinase